VPAYTCKAVVESAILAGKTVHFAECSADTFNIDYEQLPKNLDPDWIVLATHQYGFCSDILKLVEYSKRVGALVIEDVAAAFGSKIDQKLAGTFGDASFFSFDSTKLINAPLKAGFLLVKDPDLFKRCSEVYQNETSEMPLARQCKYLVFGCILNFISNKYFYRIFHYFHFSRRQKFTEDRPELNRNKTPFYSDRVTNWQAWIVLKQLGGLDLIYSKRRLMYQDLLAGLSECRNIKLPPQIRDHDWIPIRFPILVPKDKLSFYEKGCEKGVDFAFSFSFIGSPKSFTESQLIADRVLNLPFYFKLSPREVLRVVEVIKKLDEELYAS